MTLQELFDELLELREVQVAMSKVESEKLRVALVKKWSKYKVEMDDLGFLADDLLLCSLGRRAPASPGEPYTFVLAPKLRQTTQYEVLTTN